jgi:hypothetical protein
VTSFTLALHVYLWLAEDRRPTLPRRRVIFFKVWFIIHTIQSHSVHPSPFAEAHLLELNWQRTGDPLYPGDDYYPGLAGESRVQATHSTQATITTLASQVSLVYLGLAEDRRPRRQFLPWPIAGESDAPQTDGNPEKT